MTNTNGAYTDIAHGRFTLITKSYRGEIKGDERY